MLLAWNHQILTLPFLEHSWLCQGFAARLIVHLHVPHQNSNAKVTTPCYQTLRRSYCWLSNVSPYITYIYNIYIYIHIQSPHYITSNNIIQNRPFCEFSAQNQRHQRHPVCLSHWWDRQAIDSWTVVARLVIAMLGGAVYGHKIF